MIGYNGKNKHYAGDADCCASKFKLQVIEWIELGLHEISLKMRTV